MFEIHEFLFFLLSFLSEFLGTLSGFGASTFFVPLAQWLEKYHIVLVLSSILQVFGNSFRIWHFREAIDKKLVWRLAIPSILMAFLGALLNPYVSLYWAEKSLGAFVIFWGLYQFFNSDKEKITLRHNSKRILFLMSMSGFLTGFIGTGGALRGIALTHMGLPQSHFIVLSSLIDVGGDVVRLIIYIWNGYMDWSRWYYIPILALAALLGARLGKRIVTKFSLKAFYRVVAVFVILSGLSLFFKT